MIGGCSADVERSRSWDVMETWDLVTWSTNSFGQMTIQFILAVRIYFLLYVYNYE